MIEEIKKLIQSNIDTKDGILINYNIDEYILKLDKYATILTYYSKAQLIGFIAYYSNDFTNRTAYLTMIIIDKRNRGEGLGKLLLKSSIYDLSHRGFKNFKLEVLKDNVKAIKIYEKFGFVIEEDRDNLWLLNLNIINE